MNSCAVCGVGKHLTEHHMHPESFRDSYPNGPENINEQANLVVLCRACHDCVHERKPLHTVLREVKQKLRRPRKPRKYSSEIEQEQADKDISKLIEGYNYLVLTLEDPHKKEKIETYRRIIRTVERLHLTILGKKPIVHNLQRRSSTDQE
jgi:hypothetical protein